MEWHIIPAVHGDDAGFATKTWVIRLKLKNKVGDVRDEIVSYSPLPKPSFHLYV